MKTIIALMICCLTLLCGQESLYKNPKAGIEDRIKDLLPRLTLEEKVDMLSGTGFATKPLERLGIPALLMTDGPVGVRWDSSVALPASIMLAATFDTSLAYRYGRVLARETKAKGRNTILGPCVNINRVPHGGRNFESYGEDPFLASRIAVSYIRGVQNQGVVATTKHFAVNNQETDRMKVNAKVDKRTLYEIYFPAFKAAVQEAKTDAIMCAYNKLNGPYCSENEMLLNDVLKNEWGFDGLVMSDWGAVHSTDGVAQFGLDLEMPGGDFLTKEKLLPLIEEGKVNESVIDDKIKRLLRVMFRRGYFDTSLDIPRANAPEHRAVALDVARSGIVLLKNDNAILPLDPRKTGSIAVIGPNAGVLRIGGGGSSMVTPAFNESPIDGIRRTFPTSKVTYAVGARLMGDVPPIEPKYFFVPNDTAGRQGLQAEYFDNKELRGNPKLRRIDANIDFHWGGDRPADGFGKDHFSVRWTSTLRPALSGTYDITAASDDGIRVFIDGTIIIDHWSNHAVEARSASVKLEAGRSYDIKVEFYEDGGDAAAMLGWIKPGENELTAAVENARHSDLAIIFAGNSHYQESEGFDRPSIDLPENQIELINEVAKVNSNTIVVLHAGAQVNLLPWLHSVRSLVWAFFPGQEGTQALMDVVTGVVNPSGKLPFTIAQRWEDYSAFGYYPGANEVVEYTEGIFVGYRYFDTKKVQPLFPFGFGLSYSEFSISDLKIKHTTQDIYEVTVTVTNNGTRGGSETVQLYVHDKKPSVSRPEKELKAFAKVFLNAGEKKSVTLRFDQSALQYYDDTRNQWKKSQGGYTVMVGNASAGKFVAVDIP